jgi:hypothetical protein
LQSGSSMELGLAMWQRKIVPVKFNKPAPKPPRPALTSPHPQTSGHNGILLS